MRVKLAITIIIFTLCAIATQSTSKEKGVSWNEKKKVWQAVLFFNNQKRKYYFQNKCDAVNKIKKLSEKMETPSKNLEILNQQRKSTKSKYKGVYWHKELKKWYVLMYSKGIKQQQYGGYFNDELNAAKRVNQLCQKMEIPPQNPEIVGVPNQQEQKKEKTSQYKGVYWHKESGKWYVIMHLKGRKQSYGGCFKDELDAAKRVNQLCEEMKVPSRNLGIAGMPQQQLSQTKEKTSQYKGVHWQCKSTKWYAQLSLNGKKKYGGFYSDEMDAAKRVNQLCEEMEIPPKNPGISGMPNQQFQSKQQTSQYKGVYWGKRRDKWYVYLHLKGQKTKFGGTFKDELDAAKRVNQLCQKMKIPPQNPEIVGLPNKQSQKKKKKSQYQGVYWYKDLGKWCVLIGQKGQKPKFGGYFNDELDAAKRVNQLCEEMKILPKNPGMEGIPNQPPKKKKSHYKGVYWCKENGKWYVIMNLKGRKQKFGGYFKDELDAAKRVNQICEEEKIPPQNLGIEGVPNKQSKVNFNFKKCIISFPPCFYCKL